MKGKIKTMGVFG